MNLFSGFGTLISCRLAQSSLRGSRILNEPSSCWPVKLDPHLVSFSSHRFVKQARNDPSSSFIVIGVAFIRLDIHGQLEQVEPPLRADQVLAVLVRVLAPRTRKLQPSCRTHTKSRAICRCMASPQNRQQRENPVANATLGSSPLHRPCPCQRAGGAEVRGAACACRAATHDTMPCAPRMPTPDTMPCAPRMPTPDTMRHMRWLR